MIITVKLFATLRENREKIQNIELEENTTIEEVIERLQLPADEIAIIMVNGIGKKRDTNLVNGDVLALFPPVGGG
ncbi:MAG: MoaD/ThiS family protein [Lachnospiraceae bacterium]